MQFSTLREWVDWQQQLHTSSIDLGLERIRVVARRMNLMAPSFRIVTVAGTNGKGSSAAMLEAMLRPHGRIGLYTSPHFLRYNERVRIDGAEASDEMLCAAFEQVERARGNTSLSFFEYGTLAVLWIFHEQQIDCAILEVGLGGRMDAVNLWDADVALITSIGVDHQEWLGWTREAIGREKAGILRPGRPAVCGDLSPTLSLSDQARGLGAPLQRIGVDFFAKPDSPDRWHYHHRDGMMLELPAPRKLPGRVQINNAASVLTVLRLLEAFDPDAIRHGLEEVSLLGRFQILDAGADTILDIAHNPDSAANLARNLRQYRPGRPLHAVFSVLREKDVPNMLLPLAPLFESWDLGEIESPRAMPLETLRVLTQTCRLPNVRFHPTLMAAYREATRRAADEGTVVVFGSAFAIGEFLQNKDPAAPPDIAQAASRRTN